MNAVDEQQTVEALLWASREEAKAWRAALSEVARALGVPAPTSTTDERVRSAANDLHGQLFALTAKFRDYVPCQACGWSKPRVPESHEELPVVRGALDAQADAERRLFDLRRETREHPRPDRAAANAGRLPEGLEEANTCLAPPPDLVSEAGW